MKKFFLLIVFLYSFQVFSQDFLVLIEQGNLIAFTSKKSTKTKERVSAGKIFPKNTTIILDTDAYLLLFNPKVGLVEFQGSQAVDLSKVLNNQISSSFKSENIDSALFKELIAVSKSNIDYHKRYTFGTCLPTERCPPPQVIIVEAGETCSSKDESPIVDSILHIHLKLSPYYYYGDKTENEYVLPVTLFIKNIRSKDIIPPQNFKITNLIEELCVNVDLRKTSNISNLVLAEVKPHRSKDSFLKAFFFDNSRISESPYMPKVQDEKDWYGFLRLAYFYEQNNFFYESLRYWEKVLALKSNVEALKILYRDFRVRNKSIIVFSKEDKCLKCVELNPEKDKEFREKK